MQAITEGPQLAPHLAVQAEVVALKAPFDVCDGPKVQRDGTQRLRTHLRRGPQRTSSQRAALEVGWAEAAD
jgi:hypothetical protein